MTHLIFIICKNIFRKIYKIEDQRARPVLKYIIGLKRIINYLISREDKTDEIKDKTGLKLMKMGI